MEETGSYGIPRVEHARVSDAMNKKSCPVRATRNWERAA